MKLLELEPELKLLSVRSINQMLVCYHVRFSIGRRCRWPSRFKVPNRARALCGNPALPFYACSLALASAFCCVAGRGTRQQQQENVMNIKHLLTFVHRCYRRWRQRWRWRWRTAFGRVSVAATMVATMFIFCGSQGSAMYRHSGVGKRSSRRRRR